MAKESSSNGLEKRPKLRFPGFDEPWKQCRIGDIYAERSQRGASDMELLSVTMNDGVMPRSEIEGKDNSSEDKSNYKVVLTGDMVYNSMRMWQGANGISPCDGIVSPAYTVLVPKIPISNGYFAALFKSPNLINEFRKNSQGMTSDTWNLKYPQIETIKVSIPALLEQERIADMLGTLEKRITKQAQLVDSLKKYKRGLLSTSFSNVTSWRKKKLGDMCCIRTGKLDANAMVQGGQYPFFTCAREHYTIDSFAFDTDALLISGNGNVGYIHHYTGKFNAYQRTYVLDQFCENIDYVHVFLDRFLSSRIYTEKKAGNTPYIVLSTLSDMEIFLPDEGTMKNLVEMFARIGKHIENSNQILEHYISLRKGLMQLLFI